MAATQRYWDGEHWTEHIAPANVQHARGFTERAVRRIGLALAILFAVPVALLAFNGPSSQGLECGSWLDSNVSDLDVASRSADILLEGGGDFDLAAYKIAAANCQDKLSTQRTIAFVLIGLGIGARIAVPMIAKASGLMIAEEPRTRPATHWPIVAATSVLIVLVLAAVGLAFVYA